MNQTLNALKGAYPHLNFKVGDVFYWSPKNQTVYYAPSSSQPEIACWSLLHEVSHGILNHHSYRNDFELLELEMAAWDQAIKLARKLSINIDQDHVQDCLDTYRDWLFRRSSCPTCSVVSNQVDETTYQCFNCRTEWTVSRSRFCRPYRMVTKY